MLVKTKFAWRSVLLVVCCVLLAACGELGQAETPTVTVLEPTAVKLDTPEATVPEPTETIAAASEERPAARRPGGGRVPPVYANAAETLGVTAEALTDAVGFPPDLEQGAKILGVPLEELQAAFPGRGGADQSAELTVNTPDAQNGYTLVAPLQSTTTSLIDIEGQVVHTWESAYVPGESAYLLESGRLLRSGSITETGVFSAGFGLGVGGIVELFDWDGDLLWQYILDGDQYVQHHDIEPLPNGNVLLLAYEFTPRDEALALGRHPDLISPEMQALWSEAILEVDPETDTIVWEWHVNDHLVQNWDGNAAGFDDPEAHPELIHINYIDEPLCGGQSADWIHANAVDYNPELDLIVMTSRCFSEFWIIDHSTSSEEAASYMGGNYGKGGDLLYRWGNPATYGGVNDAAAQTLWAPHDPRWVESDVPGEIHFTVFNNGTNHEERPYSSVLEVALALDDSGAFVLPAADAAHDMIVWEYTATPPEDFFAGFMSGVQKQPNGDYLIVASGVGRVFEASPEGEIVWECLVGGSVFRADRYWPGYAGLERLD